MCADRDLTEGQVLALTDGDAIRGVAERGVVDQLGLVRVRDKVEVRVRIGVRARARVQSSELN